MARGFRGVGPQTGGRAMSTCAPGRARPRDPRATGERDRVALGPPRLSKARAPAPWVGRLRTPRRASAARLSTFNNGQLREAHRRRRTTGAFRPGPRGRAGPPLRTGAPEASAPSGDHESTCPTHRCVLCAPSLEDADRVRAPVRVVPLAPDADPGGRRATPGAEEGVAPIGETGGVGVLLGKTFCLS